LRLVITGGLVAAAGFALSSYSQVQFLCQTPSEMRPAVENLNFSEGAPGSAPPEWFLGMGREVPGRVPVYEAKIAAGSSCNGSRQCATVRSIGSDPSVPGCFLYQIVDARPYRGKKLNYWADVRAEVAPGSVARLLVRVHRTDCSTSFRDDMGEHPITSGTWSPYEVRAPIAMDARDIEFGIQLIGQGGAWIDNMSMTYSDAVK
jgi:hypothetical protein